MVGQISGQAGYWILYPARLEKSILLLFKFITLGRKKDCKCRTFYYMSKKSWPILYRNWLINLVKTLRTYSSGRPNQNVFSICLSRLEKNRERTTICSYSILHWNGNLQIWDTLIFNNPDTFLKHILGDPEVTANIYRKLRNLPKKDKHNYSTDLR